MMDFVKVSVPFNQLIELLEKKAELEAIKRHVAAEVEADASGLIYAEKIAKICGVEVNQSEENNEDADWK